jgi:hypothetical protein
MRNNPDNPWLFFIKAESEQPNIPRSIKSMYFKYRRTQGKLCRNCKALIHHSGNTKLYLKCEKYGITNGAATDWRAKWDACGLFEEKI